LLTVREGDKILTLPAIQAAAKGNGPGQGPDRVIQAMEREHAMPTHEGDLGGVSSGSPPR
jgi:hypothetical protein